jgi:hypothetical protein
VCGAAEDDHKFPPSKYNCSFNPPHRKIAIDDFIDIMDG